MSGFETITRRSPSELANEVLDIIKVGEYGKVIELLQSAIGTYNIAADTTLEIKQGSISQFKDYRNIIGAVIFKIVELADSSRSFGYKELSDSSNKLFFINSINCEGLSEDDCNTVFKWENILNAHLYNFYLNSILEENQSNEMKFREYLKNSLDTIENLDSKIDMIIKMYLSSNLY